MKKIAVGIAGTGYTVGIAGNHVHGYQHNSECRLAALYDIIPGRAEKWAAEKGIENVEICGTFDELLSKVDAVSICTPNYAHVPMVIRAIEAGKHVLCEKPLSTDALRAAEAVRYAKSSRTIKMIGFSYRGIPAVRYMKQLLDSGKMGRIFTYRETLGGNRITNPDVKLEWRMQKDLSGTGALADFGCHMLDLCDWLLQDLAGPMVQACGLMNCAIPAREKISESGKGAVTNDDYAAFNVAFREGAVASFLASRIGVARHTLEIYGSGGMMLFRDDRPNELEVWFKDPDGGYSGKAEVMPVPEELVMPQWFDAEINEFIASIRSGNQPERNLERALYIQKIIDAIQMSCQTGRTVEL